MSQAATRAAPVDAPYWQGLHEGRLVMQHCQGCGRWHWPSVWRCGECGAWSPEWREIALAGVVYSWTTTWHPFAGTEAIGKPPFTTVLVALPQAGGRRLFGLFEGDDAALALDKPLKGRIDATKVGDAMLPAIRWRIA